MPTIVVSFKSDQPFWGKRVQKLGVGPAPVARHQLNADQLAQAIKQALDDQSMRRNAAALGEKIHAEDGVGNAVRIIDRVLEGRKVRAR